MERPIMELDPYVARCGGLEGTGAGTGFKEAAERHRAALRALLAPEALAATEPRWRYRVPELGEGGACSLFGQLAEAPYDLAATLGGRTPANRRLVAAAALVVDYYRRHSRSHWFGIYQARRDAAGAPTLVKLAYFGAESRAEFPLTEDFARGSNNSAVGLSGRGRVINDVAAFVAEGGGYYTCDPKVKAEACLPVFARDGSVAGILDSEAFEAGFFAGEELALAVAVAVVLSEGVLESEVSDLSSDAVRGEV